MTFLQHLSKSIHTNLSSADIIHIIVPFRLFFFFPSYKLADVCYPTKIVLLHKHGCSERSRKQLRSWKQTDLI